MRTCTEPRRGGGVGRHERLQVQFREGTLSPSFRDGLLAGTGAAVLGLKDLGWALHCKDLDTGGDLVSLLWKGGGPGNPAKTPPGGVIASKARLILPFAGFEAKFGAGSRTTRVLMRYGRMCLSDETPVPAGQRIELLNILSKPREAPGSLAGVVASLMREQITVDARLPVEIQLKGGTSLLNDGGPNTLGVTIASSVGLFV